MPTQKNLEPSKGVSFFNTRFSPVKFLTTDDDRDYTKGSVVNVGGDNGVYGPYVLDMEIGRGNGKIHWKAFAEGSNGQMSSKPKTKAELEQELAQKDAGLEKARADYRAATGQEPTF